MSNKTLAVAYAIKRQAKNYVPVNKTDKMENELLGSASDEHVDGEGFLEAEPAPEVGSPEDSNELGHEEENPQKPRGGILDKIMQRNRRMR